MGLVRIVAPTDEPFTLDQVKEHLRYPHDDQDNYMHVLIAAARAKAEAYLKRSLMPQTWRWTLDEFPATWFDVPRPPLRSAVTLTYLDGDSAAITLYDSIGSPQVGITDYILDTQSQPGRILLPYGGMWPTPLAQANSVVMTYEAGYDDAESIPEDIRLGMLMLISHWFEHRESVTEADVKEMPQGATWLMDPYRVLSIA